MSAIPAAIELKRFCEFKLAPIHYTELQSHFVRQNFREFDFEPGKAACTENLIRVDDVMESPKLAE